MQVDRQLPRQVDVDHAPHVIDIQAATGEVEVIKHSAASDEERHVTTLAEGSHFGETALVREGQRIVGAVAENNRAIVDFDDRAHLPSSPSE